MGHEKKKRTGKAPAGQNYSPFFKCLAPFFRTPYTILKAQMFFLSCTSGKLMHIHLDSVKHCLESRCLLIFYDPFFLGG